MTAGPGRAARTSIGPAPPRFGADPVGRGEKSPTQPQTCPPPRPPGGSPLPVSRPACARAPRRHGTKRRAGASPRRASRAGPRSPTIRTSHSPALSRERRGSVVCAAPSGRTREAFGGADRSLGANRSGRTGPLPRGTGGRPRRAGSAGRSVFRPVREVGGLGSGRAPGCRLRWRGYDPPRLERSSTRLARPGGGTPRRVWFRRTPRREAAAERIVGGRRSARVSGRVRPVRLGAVRRATAARRSRSALCPAVGPAGEVAAGRAAPTSVLGGPTAAARAGGRRRPCLPSVTPPLLTRRNNPRVRTGPPDRRAEPRARPSACRRG